MRFRSPPECSLRIPVIAQGCQGFGSHAKANAEEQIASLRLGIDLGMTLIDTAEAYGNGESEELVGRAIHGIRDQVVLATKCSPEHLRGPDVILAAERSLRRLKTDYIDLYQVHWPNPAVPVDETMYAMRRLIDSGKVRWCGVSNFSLDELSEAAEGPVPPVVNQLEYNTLEHTAEAALDDFSRLGALLLGYSPFFELSAGLSPDRWQLLQDLARNHSATPAQIVLAWLVFDARVVVIAKANSAYHVQENAAAANITLTSDDLRALRHAFHRRIEMVSPTEVQVGSAGTPAKVGYATLEEALRNEHSLTPSPAELAKDLVRRGQILKPIKLVQAKEGRAGYLLMEGQVRYWASVIAFGVEQAIPAHVMDNRGVIRPFQTSKRA